jgi:hypothetical protein
MQQTKNYVNNPEIFMYLYVKKLKTKSKYEIDKKNLAKNIIRHQHSKASTRPLRLAHNFQQQL